MRYQTIRLSFVIFCLALDLLTIGVRHASGQAEPGTITVGPAEIVRGPDNATDTAFHTFDSQSGLRSYVANGTTWTSLGGSLETLPLQQAEAITPGAAFDSCGAWLNSVWRDGSLVRGWYHAETECAYPTTHKSVAYAESKDDGVTFEKPDYPFNQVISAPSSFTNPDKDDEGDHHVIQVGDYLYMYFIASRDYQVRLARSHIADGGKPGTWYKYYQGSFTEPGLGGESSPIDPSGALTRSWVTYNTYLQAYIGFSYEVVAGQYVGFGLMFSPDGIRNWQRLGGPIQLSSGAYWNRDESSPELAEYPSLLSVYGDSTMTGQAFWLYFMYLRPGEDFDDGRYLMRRLIQIEPASGSGRDPSTPRVALSSYQHGDDSWVTTTAADPLYTNQDVLGSLFTLPVSESTPVYDCYIPFWNDHMLVPGDSTCAGGNVRVLGRIGWISTVNFPNAVAVYRCWDAAQTNHFISVDPNCEGKKAEWLLGYLAPPPRLMPIPSVALSTYLDAGRYDSWATTALPGSSYLFQQRLGYLFRSPQAERAPMYDCYISFWEDHMVTIDDATCDGNTMVGMLGWIAREPFPGSVAVYRCWDAANTNHFLSQDSNCEGAKTEWRAGYLARIPLDVSLDDAKRLYLPVLRR